ncbi:hypothetical protein BGZ83_005918 [Gryganskiella cystojenkinii]|nr:hypothetical protein BGZ83_005918 [Gryganskiella cystojenkinii]
MAKSASVAGTSPAPTASATAFMSGMADPSAALALQTLLATVSQVNAATGSTPQPSQSDQLYAYARQPQPTVPQPQTFQSELPPVLQQLQGFLSNSYQTPNNNSLASSTATTGVDSSAGNSRNIAAITTTTSFPPIPPPVLSTFGSGHGQSLMTGTGAGPSATGPMTHPLPPRPGVASVIGLAPAARDPRAKADPRHAAKENGVQIGPGSTTTHPPAQSRQPHALPPPPTTRWPIPQTPGTASSTLAGTTTGPTNGPRMPSAGPAPGPGQIPLPPPPHLSGMRSLMDSSMMSRPGMHPFLNSNPHQEGQGGDHSRTNSDQISPSPGASYMNGGFNSMQANGLGRGNAGPIDSRPKVGASGEGAPVATMITIEDDSSIGPDQIRVVSRTLWVGGTFIPTISEQELESIFTTKGSRIATLMVNHAKYNAFIKMVSRAHAEHCKTDLDRTQVHGETMKVGWGCGFGPRDCFDYTSGSSVIPLDRLTDTDRRWLSNSVVGGFGTVESIRGGVKILEPNIEPILGPDGREALPRKGGKFGTGGGGGTGGRGGSTMRGGDGDRGRGRGRGRGGGHVGGMDHQSFATGASGSNQFQLGKRGDHQSQEGGVVGGDLAHQWIQGPRNDGLQRETTEPRKKSRWE